jgi:hypothetical protein
MGMNIKGVVYKVSETKQVSDKFSKRELIVEIADNPKYPQLVQFEATKDRCSLLDNVNAGDSVSIEFDLRGREWRSPSGDVKFFNTLNIWKLEVTSKTASAPASSSVAQDEIPF